MENIIIQNEFTEEKNMKSIKRLLFATILVMVLSLTVISVSATDATLPVGIVSQNNEISGEVT